MSSREPEPVHPQQPERRPSDMHTNARAMMREYRDRKSLHACAAGPDKAECRRVVVGTGAWVHPSDAKTQRQEQPGDGDMPRNARRPGGPILPTSQNAPGF
jgi:hypothetical protein